MKRIADTGADKQRTVSSTDLSYMSVVYPLSEFSADRSVRCLSGVWILSGFSVRCLSVRILSVSILSGVRILSGFLEKKLSGVCLSGLFLSRFCPLSGFCPDFSKKLCPLSVCPAGQGQDRAVRIFAVLVRRRPARTNKILKISERIQPVKAIEDVEINNIRLILC